MYKDLRIVYELYRTAIVEESVLYKCKDEEQAKRWEQHFNRNLPLDRWACIIRENEEYFDNKLIVTTNSSQSEILQVKSLIIEKFIK